MAVALVLTACGGVVGQPGGGAGDTTAGADLAGSLSAGDAATAADGVNAFGFDLHTAVARDGDNTVTSPLSASVLLAMVAAGAGGDNAEEMVEPLVAVFGVAAVVAAGIVAMTIWLRRRKSQS